MESATTIPQEQPEQEIILNSFRDGNIFKNYFDMPVWQLRHLEVSNFIRSHDIKHVLDIGCAQGTLINRLSRSYDIEQLIGIDYDSKVLQNAKYNVQPEMLQYSNSFHRANPLNVELYHLNALKDLPLQRFTSIQLITIIQFIEHIKLEEVPILCDQVFKKIRPKYVTITTPNQQFNVHFDFKPNQMRHPDHIFQWNRNQFQQFCQRVEREYGYTFQIFGVGQHVVQQKYGFCSQGAHFTRIEKQVTSENLSQQSSKTIEFKPFHQVRYPFWKDGIQTQLQNQLLRLIVKYNYQSPEQISKHFKSTKICKKMEQTYPQQTLYNAEWVIEKVKSIKYCGYCQEYDYIFYQYLESSLEDQQMLEDEFQSIKNLLQDVGNYKSD